MKKKLIVIIAVVCLILSCEYKPTEVIYKEVKKVTENSSVKVVINDENQLKFITGNVQIYFKLIIGNVWDKEVKIYLDNKILYSYVNSEFIDFASEKYTDGHHILKFEMKVPSGSGSLADKYRFEKYIYIKEYPIYIYNNTTRITKHELVDRRLKLTWTKCTHPEFKKYVILTSEDRIKETTVAADTTAFYDGYAGEEKNYTLITYIGDKDKFITSYYHHSCIPAPSMNLRAEIIDNKKIKLTWNKFYYTRAFNGYNIDFRYNNNHIYKISDTTFIDENPYLYANNYYRLNHRSKAGALHNDYTTINLGTKSNVEFAVSFPKIINMPSKGEFLLITNDAYRINLTEMKKNTNPNSNRKYIYSMVSPNEQKLFKYYYDNTMQTERLMEIDINSWEVKMDIDFKKTFNFGIDNIWTMNVSNNSRLFVLTKEKLVIIDLMTMKIIAGKEINSYGNLQGYNYYLERIKIDYSGNYFIVDENLYKIENPDATGFCNINIISKVRNNSIFIPDKKEIIQITSNNKIVRTNVETQEIISTFTYHFDDIPSLSLLYYNSKENILNISSNGKLILLDLLNNGRIKDNLVTTGQCFYLQNKIIGDGIYYNYKLK